MTAAQNATPAKKLPSIAEMAGSLTGYETCDVEDHFKMGAFEELSTVRQLAGLVFTYLKRTDDSVTWDTVMRLKQTELLGYFTGDPDPKA